jgi:hypothetical protein
VRRCGSISNGSHSRELDDVLICRSAERLRAADDWIAGGSNGRTVELLEDGREGVEIVDESLWWEAGLSNGGG